MLFVHTLGCFSLFFFVMRFLLLLRWRPCLSCIAIDFKGRVGVFTAIFLLTTRVCCNCINFHLLSCLLQFLITRVYPHTHTLSVGFPCFFYNSFFVVVVALTTVIVLCCNRFQRSGRGLHNYFFTNTRLL